jgi:hypothetical protein
MGVQQGDDPWIVQTAFDNVHGKKLIRFARAGAGGAIR